MSAKKLLLSMHLPLECWTLSRSGLRRLCCVKRKTGTRSEIPESCSHPGYSRLSKSSVSLSMRFDTRFGVSQLLWSCKSCCISSSLVCLKFADAVSLTAAFKLKPVPNCTTRRLKAKYTVKSPSYAHVSTRARPEIRPIGVKYKEMEEMREGSSKDAGSVPALKSASFAVTMFHPCISVFLMRP